MKPEKNPSDFMKKSEIITKTKEFVKRKLGNESSGHDWWHTYRVWKTALQIAKKEGADTYVVQLSALLHDISDWKFNKGDASVGSNIARHWLKKQKVDEKTICLICEIIQNISFKGAKVKNKIKTKEGKIVQDADRLDAIGAIGIARTFAFGGKMNNPIYAPDINPVLHKTKKSYLKQTHTINHFYEKLLLLKDRMNTKTGKKMAEKRHNFMKLFLKEFFKEWNCNK